MDQVSPAGRWPSQHRTETERKLAAWRDKPLLRQIYGGFYDAILRLLDPTLPGRVVEIGAGIGNLKARLPHAIATDLATDPWLDVACDGYELPFRDHSLSHLILFDVFHHLQEPQAFRREARRALAARGRLILFEPYISWSSFPVYALLHHEPVAWRQPISSGESPPNPRHYYAAQGNATRLFFRYVKPGWPEGWALFHVEAFAGFSYLLSGGFSKPAMYPANWLPWLQRGDEMLSRWPRAFGARCLIGLQPVP